MELSIEEAAARFAEAAAAAARGERVVITKHGQPFVELIPARRVGALEEDRAAKVRRDLGLVGLTVQLPPEFDDAILSRKVLGLTG